MSSALADVPAQARLRSASRLFDPGGPATLDDVVTSLVEHGCGRCLVCGAELPGVRAGEPPPACPSCGSRLE